MNQSQRRLTSSIMDWTLKLHNQCHLNWPAAPWESSGSKSKRSSIRWVDRSVDSVSLSTLHAAACTQFRRIFTAKACVTSSPSPWSLLPLLNSSLIGRSISCSIEEVCMSGGRSSSMWLDVHFPPWKPTKLRHPPTILGSCMTKTMWTASIEGRLSISGALVRSSSRICLAPAIRLKLSSPESHWTRRMPGQSPPRCSKKALSEREFEI